MRTLIVVVLGIMMAAGQGLAQDLSVDQIVEKANFAAYYGGDDGLSDANMTIKDAQGRTRNRVFRILRYDVEDGGEQRFYVYFYKPTDVSRMVYMVWKHIGRDDDRWLYLPAMDLVRRIASSDKRSSFVGSHFVYEDVSGRGTQADTHKLIETTDEYYKVRNIPKDTKGVEFAYYDVWIRKDNFLPYKSEYYDSLDKMYRSIEAMEIKDIEGIPTVVKSVAKDATRGGETTMEFSNIDYNVGFDASLFEERYLRRPAMQWLKEAQ
ncbi:MAG: outer membrane lipoprotein-sorting protein [Candidatus Omnitrophota bacterium]